MLNLTVNTNNQITNTGFTYDAAGNMTNDTVRTPLFNPIASTWFMIVPCLATPTSGNNLVPTFAETIERVEPTSTAENNPHSSQNQA